MEIIRGKNASFVDSRTLSERLHTYDSIQLDIGTGDGRYVEHTAKCDPRRFVIGVDACRENLHKVSSRAPVNALYVIANALTLPAELHGLADHVSINFPWGSLMAGLLNDERDLFESLHAVMRSRATLDVYLNGGAVSEQGWELTQGAARVREVLQVNGFEVRAPISLATRELRDFPSSWAKRLAFGRDPRAVYLSAHKKG